MIKKIMAMVAGLALAAGLGIAGVNNVVTAQAATSSVQIHEPVPAGTRFCTVCVWVWNPYTGGYDKSCTQRVCQLV